jgi:hypothetical protein
MVGETVSCHMGIPMLTIYIVVPVIAILTKIDSFEDKIRAKLFWQLEADGMSLSEAMKDAASQAASCTAARIEDDYVRRLQATPYQPKDVVQLRGRPFPNWHRLH